MELTHLLQLVSELPKNTTLNYVRGTDTCTFVSVDIIGERIYSLDPNGDSKSWAPSYLQDLAPKIRENVPFNLSGLLNNKGSFRPVLETIIAHTKEFYTLKKGTATLLVWVPSMPKKSVGLEEIAFEALPPSVHSEEDFNFYGQVIINNDLKEDYTIGELSSILKQMNEALGTSGIHLFALKYGSKLIGKSIKQILNQAGLSENYQTEISKMRGVYKALMSNNFGISFYLDDPSKLHRSSETEAYIKECSRTISSLPLQQIFYGAPGTGKSFAIDDMAVDERTVRTTFHPDSDYASFVGAYKPTMAPMPINAFVGTTVHHAKTDKAEKAYENKIVYKYVPQAFLKAYVAAWKDLDNDYYLVIEEINRGNCAQIFGDLFQLLDRNSMGCSSYAIHADDDIRQFLANDTNGFAELDEDKAQAIREFVLEKDNGKTQAIGEDILAGKMLLLPPNLHIWATMNTSDQSLFPIDSAFKRRWDWHYTPIDYNPKDKRTGEPLNWKFRIGDNLYSWGEFLNKINKEIYTLTESEDKQMGYFFAKADRSTGIISQEVFLNKVLFYLWTDVFKDYDVSSELFKNVKEKRSFRFTDFFEDPEALENFIANFNIDAEEQDSDSTSGSEYNSIRVKVNGSLETSMTQSMIAILKDAAVNYTMAEIEGAVSEFITRGETPIIKRIDSPETYVKENRWNPTMLTSSDGIAFVVTTMWQRRFLPMIEKLASHFSIPFEVINE